MSRPRRSRRRLDRNELARVLQLTRLTGLSSGRYVPKSDREAFCLKLVQDGQAVDVEDFVLSADLLSLKAPLCREQNCEPLPVADPFSTDLEPAIPNP